MNAQLLARRTTIDLVEEAIRLFGPLTERDVADMLDEGPRSMSSALSHLLLRGRVHTTRTADCRVVLYAARGMP